MLCSIATLIHDSYLPVYAQDVLGLSNTSIGAVQGLAQFLCQLTKGVSGVAGDLLGSQVCVEGCRAGRVGRGRAGRRASRSSCASSPTALAVWLVTCWARRCVG